MTTNSNSTESNKNSNPPPPTPTTSSGYVDPNKVSTPPAPVVTTTEVETDDLGYEVPPEEAKVVPPATIVQPEKTKGDEPAKEDEKIEAPVTGYGKKVDEPAKAEVPPAEPKVEASPEKIQLKKDFDEVTKTLPQSVDKDKVTNFALENNFTKEQLEAYVKLTKDEEAKAVKDQKDRVEAQRAQYVKDLETDPDFGGENFERNVGKVEKLLLKMPNTKKVLTDKGGMLPPYLMKDFLALSKLLNPTVKLVPGEANEVKTEVDFLDEMYG